MAHKRALIDCTVRALIISCLSAAPGCGLLQRSDQATNAEDDGARKKSELEVGENPSPAVSVTSRWQKQPSPQKPRSPLEGTAEPAQKIKSLGRPLEFGGPNPKIAEADKLFHKAQREQDEAAFQAASELWQEYLERHVGMPGYARARYNNAFCLFSLGKAKEALEPLNSLIEDSQDGKLVNDARVLLAESLLHMERAAEALATTFEVLPESERELGAGIKRRRDAVGVDPRKTPPSYAQKIRLFTIRGRIFASLKRPDAARIALEKAQTLLIAAKKDQLSRYDLQFLSANYAWRKLEVIALSCSQTVTIPETLSEREFLAYAHAYYDCVQPAQKLYCTVLASENEQVRSQSFKTYKELALAPLRIRDQLPPPARGFKARGVSPKDQRSFYESEMKALIEKTVDECSRDFKNIKSCGAFDLF